MSVERICSRIEHLLRSPLVSYSGPETVGGLIDESEERAGIDNEARPMGMEEEHRESYKSRDTRRFRFPARWQLAGLAAAGAAEEGAAVISISTPVGCKAGRGPAGARRE